jgi:hypothetical protein
MKSAAERFNERMKDEPEFESFFNSQTQQVRKVIRQYPFKTYRIGHNSIHPILCPGTRVTLCAISPEGHTVVMVEPGDLQLQAIEYLKTADYSEKEKADIRNLLNDENFGAITLPAEPESLVPID